MIHYKKRTWMLLLGMFVAVFSFTFLTAKFKSNNEAAAANPWTFDAGNIMSDWQMGNYNSMSESEIQAFLSAKNPCDNRDYGLYVEQSTWYPKVSWHWDNDHFVCLSQERFGDGMVVGAGDTAAHIIWQAAQDYRINPQVLIVLLEKENGLVTDTYPHTGQYKTATGFGCPDTSVCDSQYYGFKNQIRHAAALFREVLDGGWSNYPVGANYVQYNPNPACGGTVVNIQNRATSALYRYTPYQPNWSALNAGYGIGDTCGAYGNRNFYLYFEDWFGGITRTQDSFTEATSKFEKTVEEGVYRIYSKEKPEKVADIKGGALKQARMSVHEKKDTDVDNQLFEIKYNNEDGFYTIVNPVTGSAFDVRAGKVARNNGTPIDVYPLHGGCNQEWLFEKDAEGYYTIVSRCSGRVVDLNRGTDELSIYDSHGGNNQKWRLERVDKKEDEAVSDPMEEEPGFEGEILSGVYRFISKRYPGEVIDIEGGVLPRATLISFEKRNVDFNSQEFEIRYDKSDGYYNIINPATGSAFDVRAGKVALENRTPVDVYPLHSGCNQDWTIEDAGDGYYKFRSRCSGRVLDIRADTKKLIIYDEHNGANQMWKLERVR